MRAVCTRSEKCRWATVEIGDNIDFAHNLAVSHGISAHPSEYTWYIPRDNVLSPLEKIELSFYTDFSEMSTL
jgi:hypothetical protein